MMNLYEFLLFVVLYGTLIFFLLRHARQIEKFLDRNEKTMDRIMAKYGLEEFKYYEHKFPKDVAEIERARKIAQDLNQEPMEPIEPTGERADMNIEELEEEWDKEDVR